MDLQYSHLYQIKGEKGTCVDEARREAWMIRVKSNVEAVTTSSVHTMPGIVGMTAFNPHPQAPRQYLRNRTGHSGMLRLNVYKHVLWKTKHRMIVDGVLAPGKVMNKVSGNGGLLIPKSSPGLTGLDVHSVLPWPSGHHKCLMLLWKELGKPCLLWGERICQTVPHRHPGSTHTCSLCLMESKLRLQCLRKDFKGEGTHDLRSE